MKCALSKFVDDTELGGLTDTPGSCARPGQAGDLGGVEPHEVQQGEMWSPAPGEEFHVPVQVKSQLLENSFVEKDLGVLVDKLIMS